MSEEATCQKSRCTEPQSARQVVLVGPNGTDGKRCGPYCAEHTDMLLANLIPTYTGTGDPTYRIETRDHAEAAR